MSAPPRLLPASRRTARVKALRRIEKAFMPQCRIGQCARSPPLKSRIGGRDHAAIGRVKNDYDALQFWSVLRNFCVVFLEQVLGILQALVQSDLVSAFVN